LQQGDGDDVINAYTHGQILWVLCILFTVPMITVKGLRRILWHWRQSHRPYVILR